MEATNAVAILRRHVEDVKSAHPDEIVFKMNWPVEQAVSDLATYVEAHRWRKLSKEKPIEQKYYEVSDGDGFSRAIWINDEQGMSASDDDSILAIWWRPIIGPEEEE